MRRSIGVALLSSLLVAALASHARGQEDGSAEPDRKPDKAKSGEGWVSRLNPFGRAEPEPKEKKTRKKKADAKPAAESAEGEAPTAPAADPVDVERLAKQDYMRRLQVIHRLRAIALDMSLEAGKADQADALTRRAEALEERAWSIYKAALGPSVAEADAPGPGPEHRVIARTPQPATPPADRPPPEVPNLLDRYFSSRPAGEPATGPAAATAAGVNGGGQ